MSSPSEENQIRLESKITFVEQTVSELNEVIYAQQKELDRLRAAVIRLEERLNAGSATDPHGGIDPSHTRPPHY